MQIDAKKMQIVDFRMSVTHLQYFGLLAVKKMQRHVE